MNQDDFDSEPGTSRVDYSSLAVFVGILAVAIVMAVAMVNQYLSQG